MIMLRNDVPISSKERYTGEVIIIRLFHPVLYQTPRRIEILRFHSRFLCHSYGVPPRVSLSRSLKAQHIDFPMISLTWGRFLVEH